MEQPKWITFSDLCRRWNINKYDLAELVIKGELQAHYDDDDFSGIYMVDGRILRESWDGYITGERQKPLIVDDVADCIFLISDVEEFERENGVTPHGIKKSTARTSKNQMKEQVCAAADKLRYIFLVELSGTGENVEKAWNDAVEAFSLDPGEPGSSSVEEIDERKRP